MVLLACVLVVTPLALAVRTLKDASGHGPRARRTVVGGALAAEGAYPSAALILSVQSKHPFQCTGTVVAPSLVLTAGHCAENMQTGVPDSGAGYRILTGQVNWASAGPGQVSRVVGVIPYPGFARRVDAGDAALLVLSKPVTAPAMPLARLGQAHLFGAGTSATLAGWGLRSSHQRSLTKQLEQATTVVQPASWCKRHVRPFFPKWELCAIDSAHFTTSGCFGDSGGPLMVPGSSEGELVEVGVVAAGEAHCSPRYPTIYTRVDALSGWLRSWIAAYHTAVVRSPALASSPIG